MLPPPIKPFLAMDILAKAAKLEREGRIILHMEVGQPSHPAPRLAREAAQKMLEQGQIGYTDALGLAPLRERLARHYAEQYKVSVDPQRIIATAGSSAGFVLSFLSLFNPGDRIAISAPGYPCYRNILDTLKLEPVLVPLTKEDGYCLTQQALVKAHHHKPLNGVLIMSPANPSGTMMGKSALQEVAQFCTHEKLWLISDEIYHGLTYSEPATTALSVHDDAIIINSFSKYYCMTGWRIGWMVVPERLVRNIERLAQNLYISPPALSQVAAIAALDSHDEMEEVRLSYAKNRAFLLEALPQIGIDTFHPADGAFYLYADIRRFTDDSLTFCHRMLEEIGVATAPGLDFDPENGQHFLRFSFAGSHDTCIQAVERLKMWL